MSLHVGVAHRTVYRFDRPVRFGPHIVRLRPAPHSRTPILAYSLSVAPDEHFLNWQQDPFGNWQAHLVFPQPARELNVTVDLVADMAVINPFDFFVDPAATTYPFDYDRELVLDLAPYLAVEESGPQLGAWLADIPPALSGAGTTVDFVVALNQRVAADIDYTVRMNPGVQTPEETLSKRIGSCRDSGWFLVQVLRHLGLAARFASGYLVQLAADHPSGTARSGPTADFCDLHAWAEVYLPGAGWIGLDPTSGLLTGEGHIPLACTPRPASAAPIEGRTEIADVTLEYSNEVTRIHEDPRVTRPYTVAAWDRIDAVGRLVDERLAGGDVRLTVGGEPTFVSVDEPDAPEWNITADSEKKRQLASTLTRRLAGQFAPGGLLHYGQGKWYPGEPLPRWQIGVFWRRDGEPLWRDTSLLADPWEEGSAGIKEVRALTGALATGFGVPLDCCVPAWEDPIHRLWAEARLPLGDRRGVDPADPTLTNAAGRARLVAELDADAGEPAGVVIPLHWSDEHGGWTTARWSFRRGRLFLVPGDSPIGWRLPIDSIAAEPSVADPERSLFEIVPPLYATTHVAAARVAAVLDPDELVPTTAVCVQSRGGHLWVFLPPLPHFEQFVDLIAVIEEVASGLGQPVVIEGYTPPPDVRYQQFGVAPDPGVIEVNIHPVGSWPKLVELTMTLADDARAVRLATEKFALDGTHTGTGGGCHLTLGGATPADSPILRRPDLLRSMVTFWQHHPSLSYLFSGRFIGPTSQAPRVDEGRPETLYELEIAFAELEKLGADARPWHVDRLLRHLLVDITGNTHRAEFCIDKLFSPDSERGRLGLVELRGFEMPPHPHMSLVQNLLVRALVARFWDEPYTGPLVRWNTELHDRFLLPWFVASDIAEVVEDLRRHGIDFERDWIEPFLEFRFPRIGRVEMAGVDLELRMAIEPWNVLGEEVGAGGTARYVDSSVERIQVQVEGMTGSRHYVTCNGEVVPLQTTGKVGQFVAGVRYRAWQPPSALHPTIGVHSPLVFDVVDGWNDRSIGGCTYHVIHPGGRSYQTAPVNASEAEARRASRFQPFGHPGPVSGRPEPGGLLAEIDARIEYPRTLDLRTRPAPRRPAG